MNTLCLNVPFVALSTKVNSKGETEKRFLTPFGTIDVAFRKVSNGAGKAPHFEIEVGGDVEDWISSNHTIAEFKAALLDLVCGMAQSHLEGQGDSEFDELCVRIKGAEVSLTVPCQDGSARPRNLCSSGNLT